jgi:hypothetical protein
VYFKIEFSIGKDAMSKSTADYLVNADEQSRKDEVLDLVKRQAGTERFEALRTEINELLRQEIDVYSKDDRIKDAFGLVIESTETTLSRVGRDGEVTITFNPSKWTARFKSTTLVPLDHTIGIRMQGQNPYLVEGEGKERTATGDRITSVIVDKAIRALR